MNKILVIIYILDFILIIISIINLIRANKYLNERNNDLKELIEATEANQELRFDNFKYEELIKEIYKILSENSSEKEKITKIEEVIKSANKITSNKHINI